MCILSDADALSVILDPACALTGVCAHAQSVSVLHGQGHLKGSTEIAPGIYTGGAPLPSEHAVVWHTMRTRLVAVRLPQPATQFSNLLHCRRQRGRHAVRPDSFSYSYVHPKP